MTLPPLPDVAVVLQDEAVDWRAAVSLAGDALVRAGVTWPQYTREMVRMIEDHGPYVVIAPGLALAHARPGPEVKRDGLAVVTLRNPVAFGHPHHDPVSVVLGLAVTTSKAHLASVASLANIFNDSTAVPRLQGAADPDEVRRIMGVAE